MYAWSQTNRWRLCCHDYISFCIETNLQRLLWCFVCQLSRMFLMPIWNEEVCRLRRVSVSGWNWMPESSKWCWMTAQNPWCENHSLPGSHGFFADIHKPNAEYRTKIPIKWSLLQRTILMLMMITEIMIFLMWYFYEVVTKCKRTSKGASVCIFDRTWAHASRIYLWIRRYFDTVNAQRDQKLNV